MITESIIRAARRRIAAGGKRIELRDSGPRGVGRLVLIIPWDWRRGRPHDRILRSLAS
jgi:hypothetical protein